MDEQTRQRERAMLVAHGIDPRDLGGNGASDDPLAKFFVRAEPASFGFVAKLIANVYKVLQHQQKKIRDLEAICAEFSGRQDKRLDAQYAHMRNIEEKIKKLQKDRA